METTILIEIHIRLMISMIDIVTSITIQATTIIIAITTEIMIANMDHMDMDNMEIAIIKAIQIIITLL